MKKYLPLYIVIAATVVSLFLLIFFSKPVEATTSGPNGTTTVVSTSTGQAWLAPTNATTSDNKYSTSSLTNTNQTSAYLAMTGFGFAIPANATINGFLLEFEASIGAHKTGVTVDTNSVFALKANVQAGTEQSNADVWTTTDTFYSAGGSANLWGTTWTPTDINDAGFGAKLQAVIDGGGIGLPWSATAQIDFGRITVTYTIPSTAVPARRRQPVIIESLKPSVVYAETRDMNGREVNARCISQ